jgi:hypothetical protein
MRVFEPALVIGLALTSTSSWASNWYAQMKNQKVLQCIEWTEPLDHSWELMEKVAKHSCDLEGTEISLSRGYHFICGPGVHQYVFRRAAACEAWKKIVNGERAKFDDSELAPQEVPKDRQVSWIAAFAGCMNSSVEGGRSVKGRLQEIYERCVCGADEISRYTEAQIATRGAAGMVEMYKKCGPVDARKEEQLRKGWEERTKDLPSP